MRFWVMSIPIQPSGISILGTTLEGIVGELLGDNGIYTQYEVHAMLLGFFLYFEGEVDLSSSQIEVPMVPPFAF